MRKTIKKKFVKNMGKTIKKKKKFVKKWKNYFL